LDASRAHTGADGFRTLDLSKRFDGTTQRYTVILESSERRMGGDSSKKKRLPSKRDAESQPAVVVVGGEKETGTKSTRTCLGFGRCTLSPPADRGIDGPGPAPCPSGLGASPFWGGGGAGGGQVGERGSSRGQAVPQGCMPLRWPMTSLQHTGRCVRVLPSPQPLHLTTRRPI
jgi:hypothetical protein